MHGWLYFVKNQGTAPFTAGYASSAIKIYLFILVLFVPSDVLLLEWRAVWPGIEWPDA
jgi:hypothetical protein